MVAAVHNRLVVCYPSLTDDMTDVQGFPPLALKRRPHSEPLLSRLLSQTLRLDNPTTLPQSTRLPRGSRQIGGRLPREPTSSTDSTRALTNLATLPSPPSTPSNPQPKTKQASAPRNAATASPKASSTPSPQYSRETTRKPPSTPAVPAGSPRTWAASSAAAKSNRPRPPRRVPESPSA